VEEYCAWAEGDPGQAALEAATARRLLAELYHLALALPDTTVRSDDADVPQGDWKRVYQRFRVLPFNYYSVVDPLTVPSGETMTGDLADDLADVWCDLAAGRKLLAAGRAADAYAAWRWRFDVHWGKHAADALQALHSWCAASGR
jgi:hypothetical protein